MSIYAETILEVEISLCNFDQYKDIYDIAPIYMQTVYFITMDIRMLIIHVFYFLNKNTQGISHMRYALGKIIYYY